MTYKTICFFAPRSRRSGERCFGNVKKVKDLDARACGFTTVGFVCFGHLSQKIRLSSKTCCFPVKKTRCCKKLFPCPKRLFSEFYSIDSSAKGTHICSKHLREAGTNQEVSSEQSYVGPCKVRLKILLILNNF